MGWCVVYLPDLTLGLIQGGRPDVSLLTSLPYFCWHYQQWVKGGCTLEDLSLYDERVVFQCAPILSSLPNFSESMGKGGRKETDISGLCRVALVVSMVDRLDISTVCWQFRQLSCISLRILTLGRANLWKFCYFPKCGPPQNNNLGRIYRFSNIVTLWCSS